MPLSQRENFLHQPFDAGERRRIAVSKILQNGDIIRLGKVTFKFDSLLDETPIEPLEMSVDLSLVSSQSNTVNFSRRLRTLGSSR